MGEAGKNATQRVKIKFFSRAFALLFIWSPMRFLHLKHFAKSKVYIIGALEFGMS